jgi:NitT/TauT family transport system substrate-binding protein
LSGEYTVAQQVLTTGSLRVISSIDKTETMSVVARRDKGINRISDLEGKKIGISRKSFAEYLLTRFFVLNGLSMDKVTVINLQPPQIADALERGEIDAAIVQQPYPYQIQQKLGENSVVWPANLGQPSYYLITCTETTLTEKPEVIDNLLDSLLDAETFVISHNEEAKTIAQKHVNYDDLFMNNEWPKQQLSVDLHQSVITAMEDETRWMIRNNITALREMPEFLKYISPDNLSRLKPSGVSIIR